VVDLEQRFREAYGEHVRAVAAFALRRVPAPADADDIVAETFLVAWRRFGEAPADLRPWLFGVARHVLRHHYRSAQRRDALSARLAETVADRGTPEHGWLAEALRALSENDRDVLVLTAWEGLSLAESALVLGCSPTAVGVRLHRARRRLDALRPKDVSPSARLEGATRES
jgi:RNA polymerase sigma-70 factor (ECF subfamily)